MSRSNTIIKKIIKVLTVFFAICAIIKIPWLFYSITPASIYNNLSYTYELSSLYRHIHLKQFNCTRIEYNQDQSVLISFDSKTRPGRRLSIFQYSSDECIDDIVKIRDETSLFLKNNPENELNGKKIHLAFNTYADETMHIYNYNFRDKAAENEGTDFCYYSNLEIHDIAKLKELFNAKILMFSTDVHYKASDMTIFDNYNSLEMLYCPKFFSDDALDYLKNKFPDCVITQ